MYYDDDYDYDQESDEIIQESSRTTKDLLNDDEEDIYEQTHENEVRNTKYVVECNEEHSVEEFDFNDDELMKYPCNLLPIFKLQNFSDEMLKKIDELIEIYEYNIINRTEFNRLLNEITTQHYQQHPPQHSQHSQHSQHACPESNTSSINGNEVELYKCEEIDNGDGTFTTKTYTTNELGQTVLITRLIKRVKVKRMVPKRVIERRNILKFGKCAGQPPGPEDGVTMLGDLVTFEKPQTDNKESEQSSKISSVIRCRNCDEHGHWTKDCKRPKTTLLIDDQYDGVDEGLVQSSSQLSNFSHSSLESRGASPTRKSNERKDEDKTTSYVPPHLRSTGVGESVDNTPRSIRITNLDYDTTQDDLRQLFECFGKVKRATIVKDRKTGENIGIAYIDMYEQSSAELAITKLDGYGYGNMILKVEFSKQRNK